VFHGRNGAQNPATNAVANSARAGHARRQRYCTIRTLAAARSSIASRTRDGTQAKPVSAVGLVAPTSPGTITKPRTIAKTPSAATNVSVIAAVSVANASAGNVSVSSTQTKHAVAAAAD
jgi:hypothetical protein